MSAESATVYRIRFDEKPGYLHAVVTGANTFENVRAYLRDIADACATRKFPRILIEERLEGPRLGAADEYAIVCEPNPIAQFPYCDIAYVDANADARSELTRFAAAVTCEGEALPVTTFRTVAEAEQYLRRRATGNGGPGAKAHARQDRS